MAYKQKVMKIEDNEVTVINCCGHCDFYEVDGNKYCAELFRLYKRENWAVSGTIHSNCPLDDFHSKNFDKSVTVTKNFSKYAWY